MAELPEETRKMITSSVTTERTCDKETDKLDRVPLSDGMELSGKTVDIDYLGNSNNPELDAANLWARITMLMNVQHHVSSALQKEAHQFYELEQMQLQAKSKTEAENESIGRGIYFDKLCRILNERDVTGKGHVLLSHKIVKYIHDSNYVLRKPSANGEDIIFDSGNTSYALARLNYNTILDVVKADFFTCERCRRYKIRCPVCWDHLTKNRTETMKLSILTATAEIAESNSCLMDNFFSREKEITVRNNQILSLCGYKNPSLRSSNCYHQLELFKTVDHPPIPYKQLVDNIIFMVEEKRKAPRYKNTSFQHKDCLIWVKKLDARRVVATPEKEANFQRTQSLWIVSNKGDQMSITQSIYDQTTEQHAGESGLSGSKEQTQAIHENDQTKDDSSSVTSKEEGNRNYGREENAPKKVGFKKNPKQAAKLAGFGDSSSTKCSAPRKPDRVGVRHQPSKPGFASELICSDETKTIVHNLVDIPSKTAESTHVISDCVSTWLDHFNELENDSKELDEDGYHRSYKGIPHACRRFKNIHSQNERVFHAKKFVDNFKEKFDGQLYFAEDHREARVRGAGNKTKVTVKPLIISPDNCSIEANPFVLHVANPAGEQFRKKFFEVAEDPTLGWIKGRGGGQLTYIRCATTEPCLDKNTHLVPKFPHSPNYGGREYMLPYFKIGQGNNGGDHPYCCFAATEFETSLMRTVDKIIQECSEQSIQCHHNLLVWQLAPADRPFGSHTDATINHVKLENMDPYLSSKGVPLPTQEDALTLTIAQVGKRDPTKPLRIVWEMPPESFINTNDWHLLLVGNDVHVQMRGTQGFSIKHKGEIDKTEKERAIRELAEAVTNCEEAVASREAVSNNWRLIASFRQIVVASSCAACYLKRLDACGKLASKKLYGVEADDQVYSPLREFCGMDSATKITCNKNQGNVPPPKRGEDHTTLPKSFVQKYDLTKAGNCDKYPNCSNEKYDSYHLPNVPTAISSNNSIAEDYLTASYVKAFLRLGLVTMVLTSSTSMTKIMMQSFLKVLGESKKDILNYPDTETPLDPVLTKMEPSPSLFFILDDQNQRRYFGRGEMVNGRTVRDQERLRWGAQSKGGIDSQPPMRKHGWKLFRIFINHRLYKLDEESLSDFFVDKTCRTLLLVGSGGSPQKAGGSSHNIPSVHVKEKIIGRMSHDQTLNHMNRTMIEAAMNNRCISIWLGAETYNYIRKMKKVAHLSLPYMNKEDFYHLGYFEVKSHHSSEPRTIEAINNDRLRLLEQSHISIDIQQQMKKRWAEGHALLIRCTLLDDELLDCLPMMCSEKKMLVSRRALRQIIVLDTPQNKVLIKCERWHLSSALGLEKSDISTEDNVSLLKFPISRDHVRDEHMLSAAFRDELNSTPVFTPLPTQQFRAVMQNQIPKIFHSHDNFDYHEIRRSASKLEWTADSAYKAIVHLLSSKEKSKLITLLNKDIGNKGDTNESVSQEQGQGDPYVNVRKDEEYVLGIWQNGNGGLGACDALAGCKHPTGQIRKKYQCKECKRQLHPSIFGCSETIGEDEDGPVRCKDGCYSGVNTAEKMHDDFELGDATDGRVERNQTLSEAVNFLSAGSLENKPSNISSIRDVICVPPGNNEHQVYNALEVEYTPDDAEHTDTMVERIKYINELIVDNAAFLEEQLMRPLSLKSKVAMKDIAQMMPFVSAACNARALGKSIIQNDHNKAYEAHPLQARSLSCCLQNHPLGHPNPVMDPICVYSRIGKLIEKSRLGDSVVTFPVPDIYTEEFSDDCLKALLLSFVGRPQFLNSFWGELDNNRMLPGHRDAETLRLHIENIQQTGIKVSQIFTTQYNVQEELKSYPTFLAFVDSYSRDHNSLFQQRVITPAKSKEGMGCMERRLFLDNWVELIGTCIPGGTSRNNSLLFHVYKAMTSLECLYGVLFSEESLHSLPVGYGAKECWDNIDLDSILDFGDTSRNVKHLINIIQKVIPQVSCLLESSMEKESTDETAISITEFATTDQNNGNAEEPGDTITASHDTEHASLIGGDGISRTGKQVEKNFLDTNDDKTHTILNNHYWDNLLKGLLTLQSESEMVESECNVIEDAVKAIHKMIQWEEALLKKDETEQVKSYWDQIMTNTQSIIVMEHYHALDDWELKCMLIEKNDKGDLIDMVTKQPVGVKVIDITYCEGFRNLKLLTDASLISVYPTLDKPWTHPLKNQTEEFQLTNDTNLYTVIQNGHQAFCENAGYSMDWDEIKKWPPDVFLVDFEKRKKADPTYTEVEGLLIHRVRASKKRKWRGARKSYPAKQKPLKKKTQSSRKPVASINRYGRRLPVTRKEDENSDCCSKSDSDTTDADDNEDTCSVPDNVSHTGYSNQPTVRTPGVTNCYSLRRVITRPSRYSS